MSGQVKKTYDLRVGTRVFRGVSAAVIIKNIKKGKLKPTHELSRSGSGTWVELASVPELQQYFTDDVPPPPPPVDENLFEVQKINSSEIQSNISRAALLTMIRDGDLNEGDSIRQQGSAVWTAAADMGSLQRYFDLRRNVTRERGYRGLPRDTGIPFWRDLRTPIEFFSSSSFFGNLIAILIAYTIAIFIPIPIISGPINILTTFYVYAYLFRTINEASNGRKSFPDLIDFADIHSDLFRPALQFFLSRIVGVSIILVYLAGWVMEQADFGTQLPYLLIVLGMPWMVLIIPFPKMNPIMAQFNQALQQMLEQTEELRDSEAAKQIFEFLTENVFTYLTWDPVVWIGLIFFFFYFPLALLRQASYGEFLPTWRIHDIVLSISRAAGPYLALIAILIAIDLLTLLVVWLSGIIFGISYGMSTSLYHLDPNNPVVQVMALNGFQVVITAIDLIASFISVYFIGRFLFQMRERMGWD